MGIVQDPIINAGKTLHAMSVQKGMGVSQPYLPFIAKTSAEISYRPTKSEREPAKLGIA